LEQTEQLKQLSVTRNSLWNYLISLQQTEYETNGNILHNYGLDKHLTTIKKELGFDNLNSKACQRISKEVFSSYRAFFQIVKRDKTARPPKQIEDVNKFHTIVYSQSGWLFKENNKLILNKIFLDYKTNIKDIETLNIKETRLKLRNNKWMLDLVVEYPNTKPETLIQKNKVLAFDLGVKNLGTGIDSDGNVIILKNRSVKINNYFNTQINKVKSKLSKKEKYSKSYNKLNKVNLDLYNRKNSQIKHTLHIQSKKLANMNYKTIVVGDLTVKKLMSTEGVNAGYKKKGLRKVFAESNIDMFLGFLTYKTLINHNELEKLDERWTTQTNCLTGKLFKEKVELNIREVELTDKIKIDRDLNACINIYKRYEQNHIALMTEPLGVANVVAKFNLFNEPSLLGKPTVL
jgi:transposase